MSNKTDEYIQINHFTKNDISIPRLGIYKRQKAM